jgi:hypothetical protein
MGGWESIWAEILSADYADKIRQLTRKFCFRS